MTRLPGDHRLEVTAARRDARAGHDVIVRQVAIGYKRSRRVNERSLSPVKPRAASCADCYACCNKTPSRVMDAC
jgi:hypothetical protein